MDTQLDFEITFYERLLKTAPNMVEALTILAENYTLAGKYMKGLKTDRKLAKLKPDDETVFYNLACSYSLLNMLEASLQALKKAISLGYDDFEHLQKDPDLENLRTSDHFNDSYLTRIIK